MIEFIKLARKRGLVADIIHATFNVAFASMVIFLTIAFTTTPWPAFLLVVLSKWRVIAVRPRYWWANFLSSLPDLIFGLSIVLLSWGCGQIGQSYLDLGQPTVLPIIVVQVLLGMVYVVWLISVKPRHSEAMVGFQALASQFIGLTAVFLVSHSLPLFVIMLLCFVVAFAAARQSLGIFEERERGLLASIWGIMVMELAYVSWHWSVYYQLTPLIRIPQIAIIATVIAAVAFRVYYAWHDDRRVTWEELGYPMVFTVAITLLILFAFSGLF